MSQLALTLKPSTRRWTQRTFSSMVARRRGKSRSIAEANAGRPNSIVAETRDVVVSGDGGSGFRGGLSTANAAGSAHTRPSAARPTRAIYSKYERPALRRAVRCGSVIFISPARQDAPKDPCIWGQKCGTFETDGITGDKRWPPNMAAAPPN